MATWTATGSRSVTATQALTDTPGDGSQGVILERVETIVPVLHAPGGQTFDGTGRLDGYVWTGAAWVRAPASDLDMAAANGLTDWAGPALIVDSQRGRFQLIPAAVGLSGAGTTVTTDYLCTTSAQIRGPV